MAFRSGFQDGCQIFLRAGEAGDLVIEADAVSGNGLMVEGHPSGLSPAEEIVIKGDEAVAQLADFAGKTG